MSTLEYMQHVRNLPFHQRIFRKFQQGSLRGTIITWVRMTLGIGIFAIPNYIKNFGVTTGFFILIIAALFNYFTFKLIFEVGTVTNKTTYIANVRKLLGTPFYQISRVFLCFDYVSIMVLYAVTAYNLFENLLLDFGFLSQNDMLNPEKMIFKEFSPKLIALRAIFFIVLLLLSLPNLLKEKMENMRWISFSFLIGMIILFFSILANYPWVYQSIKSKGKWEVEFITKFPQWNWVTSFFSIMFSFNL